MQCHPARHRRARPRPPRSLFVSAEIHAAERADARVLSPTIPCPRSRRRRRPSLVHREPCDRSQAPSGNLTVRGLPVSEAVIGERWAVGTALLQVSQPRLPCFKLGLRMNDSRFPKRFARAADQAPTSGSSAKATSPRATRSTCRSALGTESTSALVSRALLGERQLLAAGLAAPELPVDLRAWMHECAEIVRRKRFERGAASVRRSGSRPALRRSGRGSLHSRVPHTCSGAQQSGNLTSRHRDHARAALVVRRLFEAECAPSGPAALRSLGELRDRRNI